ncbi:MAG: hypothetical protein ACAF41_13705 [Leptolyngbya sp. BL-A-14]
MSAIIDELLVKAMILTCHDGALVKRLVLASIANNPHQSAQWHVEKVIRDLERDQA